MLRDWGKSAVKLSHPTWRWAIASIAQPLNWLVQMLTVVVWVFCGIGLKRRP